MELNNLLEWIKDSLGMLVFLIVCRYVLVPFVHLIRQPIIFKNKSAQPPQSKLPSTPDEPPPTNNLILNAAKEDPLATTQLIRTWLNEKDKVE